MDKTWTRALLRGTGLFCAGIVCTAVAVAALLLLASRELHGYVAGAVGLKETSKSILEDIRPTLHPEEKGTAEATDHYAVVRRVLACTKVESVGGLARLPRAQRQAYTENPRLLDADYVVAEGAPNIRPPNEHERAIMELSRAMFNQRGRLRDRADSAYGTWQVTALVAIVLGLLTTVTVGLTATEYGKGEGSRPMILKVVAIVLSASGTAAASVTAFYGPQAEWAEASRSLASLSHLHNQIAVEFWRIDCTDEKITKDSPLDAKLQAWAVRYADIQAAIAAPSQSTSTNGNNKQPLHRGG